MLFQLYFRKPRTQPLLRCTSAITPAAGSRAKLAALFARISTAPRLARLSTGQCTEGSGISISPSLTGVLCRLCVPLPPLEWISSPPSGHLPKISIDEVNNNDVKKMENPAKPSQHGETGKDVMANFAPSIPKVSKVSTETSKLSTYNSSKENAPTSHSESFMKNDNGKSDSIQPEATNSLKETCGSVSTIIPSQVLKSCPEFNEKSKNANVATAKILQPAAIKESSKDKENSVKNDMTENTETNAKIEINSKTERTAKVSKEELVNIVKTDTIEINKTKEKLEAPPVFQSAQLARQEVPAPGKLSKIVLPLENPILSPAQFVIRLEKDEDALLRIIEMMNEAAPPEDSNWKIGRNEAVAFQQEGLWLRGVAVKKMGERKFSLFSLDFGGELVTVEQAELRPLPPALRNFPPTAYQVGLHGVAPAGEAGWGSEVGEVMSEFLNEDPAILMGVEFLEQAPGGRWQVKLKGLDDDQDIANMLINCDVAIRNELDLKCSISNRFVEVNLKEKDHNQELVQSNKKMDKEMDHNYLSRQVESQIKVNPINTVKPKTESKKFPVVGAKAIRGKLLMNETTVGGVCYIDDPVTFYICPDDRVADYIKIQEIIERKMSEGEVEPVVGTCCLAQDEGTWQRAEILPTTDLPLVQLYLLDYGKIISANVSALRPLPADVEAFPGSVVKVKLPQLKPATGEKWTDDDQDSVILLL